MINIDDIPTTEAEVEKMIDERIADFKISNSIREGMIAGATLLSTILMGKELDYLQREQNKRAKTTTK